MCNTECYDRGVGMKIYKHRHFAKWAKKEGVTHTALKDAVSEIEQGLLDANLGGGLYKKRFARKGQGKLGGYRTLLAYKQNDRVIFIFGFAKRDKENIDSETLTGLKMLSNDYLQVSILKLEEMVKAGSLVEVLL
jgi:hypothetical protein